MADDDNGVKPEGHTSPEHVASGAATPSTRETSNEWTASDRRGPLGAAGDEDVERFVPAHETDAEGGLDTATTPAHEPASIEPGPLSTPAEPSPASPVETTSGAEPPRRSFVPIAAGVVIGALIGAGSAWLVYSQADGGAAAEHQKVASLAARVDALDKRPDPQSELATLQSGFDGLRGRVAALDKQVSAAPAKPAPGAASPPSGTPQAAGADATLAGKVAALQAALAALETRTAALQRQDRKDSGGIAQIAALQTGVADARKQADGNKTDLDGVKTAQKGLDDKIATLAAAVAAAQKDASGVQSSMASVQTQQKALADRLGSPALAVVADSLVQQIDAGRPYVRQIDALAALKADPAKIAVLRENAGQGVASAQALLAKWKALENPVIATGNVAPANANLGQRLEHGLFGLVSVRRADVATGNDLASRVAAIQSDLAGDDVPAAFTAWQALPAAAKEKSTDWGAAAKASAEALAAAHDLQHTAIDALGAKKS